MFLSLMAETEQGRDGNTKKEKLKYARADREEEKKEGHRTSSLSRFGLEPAYRPSFSG